MASGGIYDQIGGGFARYSVDATWTVPHFEKMLYDNALLARDYLHGWLVSGDPVLRRVCEETLEFILRELQGPEGGFASALDADSEGEEGRFYVWSFDDVLDALDPQDAEAAVVWLGVTAQGNFEGTNVLESRGPEPPPEQRERIRAQLMEVRDRRVRPGLDDKRLTAWNALALGALAEAGARLGREDLLDAARRNAGFLLGTHARRARAGCCGPPTGVPRSSTPTSRTTRSCSRRCSTSTRRRSSRAGSPRRGRSPTR